GAGHGAGPGLHLRVQRRRQRAEPALRHAGHPGHLEPRPLLHGAVPDRHHLPQADGRRVRERLRLAGRAVLPHGLARHGADRAAVHRRHQHVLLPQRDGDAIGRGLPGGAGHRAGRGGRAPAGRRRRERAGHRDVGAHHRYRAADAARLLGAAPRRHPPHAGVDDLHAGAAMTEHARVVVIGGGVVGASVAYHLTKLGVADVLLLERRSLTCGTTWHAAGLIGRLRGTRTASRLVDDSARLYARLPEETGQATGWKRCGSLVVARTTERLHQLRRYVALGQAVGIEAHIVSAGEAGRVWPLIRTDDLAGAMVVPDDGRVIPADVTQALAA